MSAVTSPLSTTINNREWTHWIPLIALPALAILAGAAWPPVLLAWVLAAAVYVGFKWLTFASSQKARGVGSTDAAGFLFFWPGMDADAFFTERTIPSPSVREVGMASGLTFVGLLLLLSIPALEPHLPIEVLGWLGLIGLALFLLFGLSQLISIAWRVCGVDAQPIMNKPLRATSLADFWGARWNLAFHDIGRIFVWRPITRRFGRTPAILAVFLFSGVVHDLVMSVPVRGGLGLPTLYFLLQGCAVLVERSSLGKRWRLSRGWRGRIFAAVFVLAPLGLLFHQPFLQGVVVPTIQTVVPR